MAQLNFRSARVRIIGAIAVVACLAVGGVVLATGHSTSAMPVRIADADLATQASSLTDLLLKSSVIVVARAGDATPETDAGDPEVVYTHQAFTVQQTLRGTPGSSVNVFFTGGIVHTGTTYMLQVEGQPQFTPGQDYVLFLTGPRADGEYFVIGGSQGRYSLVNGVLHAVDGTAAPGTVEAAVDGMTLSQITAGL